MITSKQLEANGFEKTYIDPRRADADVGFTYYTSTISSAVELITSPRDVGEPDEYSVEFWDDTTISTDDPLVLVQLIDALKKMKKTK